MTDTELPHEIVKRLTRIPITARIDDYTLSQRGLEHGLSHSAVDYLRYFDSVELVLHVNDDGSVMHVEIPEFGGNHD